MDQLQYGLFSDVVVICYMDCRRVGLVVVEGCVWINKPMPSNTTEHGPCTLSRRHLTDQYPTRH